VAETPMPRRQSLPVTTRSYPGRCSRLDLPVPDHPWRTGGGSA